VRELVRGIHAAGRYDIVWNGRDDHGRDAASGVYFCRLTAGARSLVRKAVLAR